MLDFARRLLNAYPSLAENRREDAYQLLVKAKIDAAGARCDCRLESSSTNWSAYRSNQRRGIDRICCDVSSGGRKIPWILCDTSADSAIEKFNVLARTVSARSSNGVGPPDHSPMHLWHRVHPRVVTPFHRPRMMRCGFVAHAETRAKSRFTM